MKKYNLISCTLTDDVGHCALGIYLAEKAPKVLESFLAGPDKEDAYDYLRDAADDLAKMVEALRPAAQYVLTYSFRPGSAFEPYHLIYRANDGLAPVELIRKALKAVGIDVELEDHRDRIDPGYYAERQAEWAEAMRRANETL